jgi:hypothetical protein
MRSTGVNQRVRKLIAAVIAALALWLLVVNVAAAAAALRSRRAFVSACDDIPEVVPTGAWVRLKGCGTRLFNSSFLTDASGRRVRQLVPLWWIDVETRKTIQPSSNSVQLTALAPSRIALALPISPIDDETGFRLDTQGGLYPDGLTEVVETTGVILARTGTPSYRVTEVPGAESGLADGAVVIDLRVPPDLGRAAWRSVIGLAILGLAWLLFSREVPALPAFAKTPITSLPRRLSSASSPQSPPRSSDVQWGRVAVFTLVGVVALARGIFWYFDPLREARALEAARVGPPAAVGDASPPAISSAFRSSSAPALPPPTTEEVALLTSVDPSNQMKGIELMNARAVTPDLVSAVDLALVHPPSPEIQAKLICLQTRFDSPESLERMIARAPRDRRSLGSNVPADVTCTLNSLARRASEAPERIRDALLPAAVASSYTTRNTILAAFKTMDLPELPPSLVVEASAEGPYRREAVAAALALGAVRLNPDLIAAAARDPETAGLVREALRTDTSDDGARLVARTWTDVISNSKFESLAVEREAKSHDVSAALLEMVLDASRSDQQRQEAAIGLGRLAEVGPLPPLRKLSGELAPGELRMQVDRAIAALDAQRARGRTPRMRALF